MKYVLLFCAFALSITANAKPHFCADEVKAQAAKFFAHYQEIDTATAEGAISDKIVERPSIPSPDRKRRYTVFETTATIGKQGHYRMRFMYAILGHKIPRQDCVLMGEEILDLSSL